MNLLQLTSLPLAIARNLQGERGLPRFLTYIVTFTCNARCIMCDSWKKPSPEDLTIEEIERIFRQLPALDGVRLTGGEPFVRSDLIDIAHLAQDHLRPLFLHITSNGFLSQRIVDFCVQRRRQTPLHLLVSVDGLAAKHNQVRGRDTAWQTATATLQALAPRRRELNLRLAVNQTIVNAEGADQYRQLREFLRPLGIRNNVVLAYDVSATYSTESELDAAPAEAGQFTTFGSFRERELLGLLDAVEADLGELPLAEREAKRYYFRGIRNRVLHGAASPNPRCVALNSHLRLYPNGDVPTCQFNSKRVGNLRHQRFAEVWESVAASDQREWVRQCPGCWAECEVLPNAFYTGDLLASLLPGRRSKTSRTSRQPSLAPSVGRGHAGPLELAKPPRATDPTSGTHAPA